VGLLRVRTFEFDGAVLEEGFWLYVWKVTPRGRQPWHYVGMTGDTGAGKAQSAFNRVSAHLGTNPRSNALKRHLRSKQIDVRECRYEFIAVGPIFPYTTRSRAPRKYKQYRDSMAALEQKLCRAMNDSGYRTLNYTSSTAFLDRALWRKVARHFRDPFPDLH
jgi:hypothetical protein